MRFFCVTAVSIIIVAIFILMMGCSHKVPITPARPNKITENKISCDIGLYISDRHKQYSVSKYKKGDKWKYPRLGEASANQFQLALSKNFESVKLFNSEESFTNDKNLDVYALVYPKLKKFTFDIPLTKFQTYPASIYYKVIVYDTNGDVLLRKKVKGMGDTQGEPGFDFTENPSDSASKAVKNGVNNAMKEILNSEMISKLQKQTD